MGLDSYINEITPNNISTDNLVYWRKNWEVHEIIRQCAIDAHEIGSDNDFNCVNYVLCLDDVDQIRDHLSTEEYNTIIKGMKKGKRYYFYSWY